MVGGLEFGVKASGVNEASKALGGLAGKFVGLQLAVNLAQKALQEGIKWVQKSIQEFRKFEKEMAEVSTILQGDAYQSLAALQGGIESLSVSFGKSAHDLTEGMYDILSAAVAVGDSLNFLTIATKASIAGLTSVAISVDVLTSILNAYGKTVEQMSYISDILFQTVIRGKLRFEDLASAMGYIAPISANLGVEFKEIAAALSTVTRQGQHVDMATRGLALGLQNIADITPKAAEAAQRYGVDLSAVALQVGGLESILKDLSEATEEYGAKVLPEMISNMRSLRVFMALTGKEGLEGYIYDLNELNKASGRTEEAMAKMMNVAQKQADILDQSMRDLERSIGGAWSSFDIWWKKSQLWWGTFLSGGDADEAISNFDDRLNALNKNFYELIKNESILANLPTFEKYLEGFTGKWDSSEAVDFIKNIRMEGELMLEPFKAIKKQLDLTEENQQLSIFRGTLAIVESGFKDIQSTLTGAPENLFTDFLRLQGLDIKSFFTANNEAIQKANELIKEYNDSIKDLSIPKIEPFTGRVTYAKFVKTISDIGKAAIDTDIKLESLAKEIASLDLVANWVKAGIDTLEETMYNAQDNVLQLQLAISGLNREIKDEYNTLSGESYEGTLNWQKAVMKLENEMNRFSAETQYAITTGAEYNGELKDVVNTLSEYKQEQDAVNTSIKTNNLEIMQIQLKQMKRRGRLTRKDQRDMKRLRIANMEERIKIAGMEVNGEEAAYNNARRLYEAHIAAKNWELYQLKDVHESEIEDLDETIKFKKELEAKYSGWLTENLDTLKNSYELYSGFIQTISKDPELRKAYDELHGIPSLLTAQRLVYDIQERTGVDLGVARPAPFSVREVMVGLPVSPFQSFDWIKEALLRWGVPYQRGTYYIPETGMYNLHRGESVSPRGDTKIGKTGGSIHIDPITVNANITTEMDLDRLGYKISQLISAGILDGLTSEYK